MLETDFQKLTEEILNILMESLENADEKGLLDVELQGGILTIALHSGKQFIINKHAPSQQIWLSSPISGGLHFSYNENTAWYTADGHELKKLLATELKNLTNINIIFS